jgi:hypothetical protein
MASRSKQVGGAGLVRERVDDLLSRPGCRGLVGDADVDEFSAVVAEYHTAEEQAKVGVGTTKKSMAAMS